MTSRPVVAREESLDLGVPPTCWDECGRLVVRETNIVRRCWSVVLGCLLVYTGTVFPFQLCFLQFQIPEPAPLSVGWSMVDSVVDILFWVDLFANFFFTFRNRSNIEVTSMRKILVNYLSGFFLLNFIACLPKGFFTYIVLIISRSHIADEHASVNQATRMARLQRIGRLIRLGRLTRLAKMAQFITHSPLVSFLRSFRGMRIANFVFGLLWIVHIIACGWYLCASLHSDHGETWVARRSTDTAGLHTLLEAGPVEQWSHAVYFVLTVFTTVGFGDMSATTTGEIVYVCFTMIMGAVINSIIVSEVINIVTSTDREEVYKARQKELIAAFAFHTELSDSTRTTLENWVENEAVYLDYDEEGMKKLLTCGAMPRAIMGRLPEQLFGGKLLRNNFIQMCVKQVRQLPPRFTLLMSLKVYQRHFQPGEFVYHYNDHPFNAFLVFGGIFAHVAKPGPEGGIRETPEHHKHVWSEEMSSQQESFAGGWSRHIRILTTSMGRHSTESPQPMTRKERSRNMEALKSLAAGMFPYKLNGPMSYFGDVELMDNKPRHTTVRCEAAVSGSLLVLQKQDLEELMNEFPHFGRAWRAAARRRERHQIELLWRLTDSDYAVNHRELAAKVICLAARRKLQTIRDRPKQSTPHGVKSVALSALFNRGLGVAPLATAADCRPVNAGLGVAALATAADFLPVRSSSLGSSCRSRDFRYIGMKNIDASQIESLRFDLTNHITAVGHELRNEMRENVSELRDTVNDLRRLLENGVVRPAVSAASSGSI